MSEGLKKFDGLAVSSKIFICGMPIRLDAYQICSFGCRYCFSNCRKIMEFGKELSICDVPKVGRILEKSFSDSPDKNLLQTLISQGITWHCGGMSDPFQPIENELHITSQLIDLTAKYGVSILFSTKSDTVYDSNIRPDLHTFQLSVSNVHNHIIEPNVPSIDKRYAFYRSLKDAGFKVGIRIQPFLPSISGSDIVDMFHDADNFTIEGLKLVPQNAEMREEVLRIVGTPEACFTQKGLLSLRPELRMKLYKPVIERLEELNIPYSISDNDLRSLGTNRCCCGDRLIKKASPMNPTTLLMDDGVITEKAMLANAEALGISDCKCSQLFTSNRTNGCVTVKDFIKDRFPKPSCTFSQAYQFDPNSVLIDEDLLLF